MTYDRVAREAELLTEVLTGSAAGVARDGRGPRPAGQPDPFSAQGDSTSGKGAGRASPRWAELAVRAAALAREGFGRVGVSLEEWAPDGVDGVRSPAGSPQETRGRHGGRPPTVYRRVERRDIPVTDGKRR
ncbi:hypothetical protein SAMN05421595_1465 [Austwickia chelonae]|uniref:Uncharacterized protein n=1 Tax=Austwickia chelonae NBRC 105200 TaxID=1184607 RepID=K6W726_9MICO|nr:hypothetical protein [Austwickia chelonae]GAB77627.1 hypothetical protein AUCHE_05_05420 [Austwickia chelonae NBRC 105200]SEW14436.1 hypothetical protein SAMN05421595_1465 [Austwickia chelonae]